MTLTLQSKKLLTPKGIIEGFVTIANGIIQQVGAGQYSDNVHSLIDFGNSVIMPGVIDTHVHINEPGRTDWEGFDTATRAAIAGGITTLVDMPLNAYPVTTTVLALKEKRAAAKRNLHCHCGYWGGLVPGNAGQVDALANAGVLGFKAFLTHSGIDEFPNVAESDLHLAMPIIATRKLPLLVHSELSDDQVRATGDPRSYLNYLASRPAKWEEDAIDMMLRLSEQYNCQVHIVHLSSASSLAKIKAARRNGVQVSVETGQHYLYFSAEEIADGATVYKCAPPIREAANNAQLWHGLQNGTIDFVATDHSPAPPELKEMRSGDFMKAWGGIASLQFALPALWTAARRRGIPLTNMAKWLSAAPAMLAGVHQRKGQLKKGYDADLVVWNPDKQFEVTTEMIHHKHKITPYLGQQLYGQVEHTFVAGSHVFNQGTFSQLHKGTEILMT